jgi:hypothetical protein
MRITMILLILNSHSIQGHERRRERNQVAAVSKKMIMEVIKKWRVPLLAGYYLFVCFHLLLRGPVLGLIVKF